MCLSSSSWRFFACFWRRTSWASVARLSLAAASVSSSMVVDWLSLCGDTAVEITNNNSVCVVVVVLYCTLNILERSTADLFRVDPHLFSTRKRCA